MGYGSLGGGILTGTIREIPSFDAHDARSGFYGRFFKEPMFSKVMEMLKVADVIANERKVSVAEIFLNWALKHDFINTLLTGVTSPETAKINTAAMNWELSDEEFVLLNEALDKLED